MSDDRANTTVYLVSTGSYSDYTVHAIFSTRELAEAYCGAQPDRETDSMIEECVLDDAKGERFRERWRSVVDLDSGKMDRSGNSDWVLMKETDRGGCGVSLAYSPGKSGHSYGYSFVSQEHADKLAVEARQLWLRCGRPKNYGEAEAKLLMKELEKGESL